jgi:hypothetical protein
MNPVWKVILFRQGFGEGDNFAMDVAWVSANGRIRLCEDFVNEWYTIDKEQQALEVSFFLEDPGVPHLKFHASAIWDGAGYFAYVERKDGTFEDYEMWTPTSKVLAELFDKCNRQFLYATVEYANDAMPDERVVLLSADGT